MAEVEGESAREREAGHYSHRHLYAYAVYGVEAGAEGEEETVGIRGGLGTRREVLVGLGFLGLSLQWHSSSSFFFFSPLHTTSRMLSTHFPTSMRAYIATKNQFTTTFDESWRLATFATQTHPSKLRQTLSISSLQLLDSGKEIHDVFTLMQATRKGERGDLWSFLSGRSSGYNFEYDMGGF